MSREDYMVYDFLNRYYCDYEIEKVSVDRESVISERKRVVGETKILGLFTKKKHEKYGVVLYKWEILPLVAKDNLHRATGMNLEISICVDSYNKKLYWKYVF